MDLKDKNWTFTGGVVGKIFPSQTKTQVRIITLNDGEHLKSTLHNVEKGWIIVFRLGPNLYGRKICIYTNHPESPEAGFDRREYRRLKWCWEGNPDTEGGKRNVKDIVKSFVKLPIRQAGSFNYYFLEESGETIKTLGSGFFTVNPVLSVGYNEEKALLLDSIQCQTVLTKCLGQFEEWPNRLLVSKESGYNVIHFTPVQELGASNSAYCIKNQLRVNPKYTYDDVDLTFDDIATLVKTIQEEWDVLCITDIVLNHTSCESPWLLEHPECSYNMITAPHLIPAAILDGYLQVFCKKVVAGEFLGQGIPRIITTEGHLQAIRWYLEGEFMGRIRLEEFFMCDVEKIVAEFRLLIKDSVPEEGEPKTDGFKLTIDPSLGRKKATVDIDLALKLFNRKSPTAVSETVRITNCVRNLSNILHERNAEQWRIIRDHLKTAINNSIATIRHQRVQHNGPRIYEISEKNPLLPRYFTGQFADFESVDEEVLNRGELVMAHNGWVMNFDPLKNFASSDSNVYIRRELVPWEDSIKLRYGDSPNDSPFLWDHMRKYVELMAEVFHGFRLDNCHSTPLSVAEHMMDCARKINPDLYIVAELFTDSDDIDNIFINRIGITSLIREEMRAWNSEELSRLIYRYGGDSVGSFHNSNVRPLIPGVARALFYDMTHDNESQVEKRSVFNCLPSTALVNMACCASGSTRGFDELVPHKIDVVDECRLYRSWDEDGSSRSNDINMEIGIISVKKKLNLLHQKMSDEGYSEVFIDQMDEDIISVTRHNPETHQSIIMIAYSAYTYPDDMTVFAEAKMLKLEGEISNILFESSLCNISEWNNFGKPKHFTKDPDYINGLWEFKTKLKVDITVHESSYLAPIPSEDPHFSEYILQYFLPGSIIAAQIIPKPKVQPKIEFMLSLAKALLEKNCESITDISSKLNLEDMNFALYSCSEEGLERGCGSYHVPGFGSLVYCGLQGFSSMLLDIRKKNDLGHPFCQNLRHGDWMMDYISERFKNNKNTRKLGLWFEEAFDTLKQIPRFLIPRYFDLIIHSVIDLLLLNGTSRMSEFVRNGSSFVKSLAMGSVQCIGDVKPNTLPQFSPILRLPYPKMKDMTMCAGLPHFSSGYMRCWGRDTFICLRGFMLLTGRYEMARAHILGYASCLRHGLIPNLLDSGLNPRYNSRDAVWWWLYSITSYVSLAPQGSEILNELVTRIFPRDDSPGLRGRLIVQPLHHIMQEALTVHFKGLNFRERNAGPGIDAHMKDRGFNNLIGVDVATGFVYGGNEYNCGTWMDKMGTSNAAGNRGIPATPRDGSAVELVGLSKKVLHELADFHDKGIYPYDCVKRITDKGDTVKWTFKEWERRIAKNFDNYFWIELTPDPEEPYPRLVHRRGIYKDSCGASQTWSDYQLRCNFLIALVLAPEMVDPEKAWKAIQMAEDILLGPLGIRTLDPSDWNYCGDYHNDDNSNNPKVAHGFNYHQGPEWLWPVGYFLRAKLHFAKLRGRDELKKSLKKIWAHLGRLYENLLSTQWKGLPELTNTYGSHCNSSCRVQAWSMACILEVLYDLRNLELN